MPRLRLARRTNSLNHLRVMLVIKTQTEEHQNPPPILKIEAVAARGRVRHKNGDFSPVPRAIVSGSLSSSRAAGNAARTSPARAGIGTLREPTPRRLPQ